MRKDEAVPVLYSRKVLKLFPNAKKKLNIIKKGSKEYIKELELEKAKMNIQRFKAQQRLSKLPRNSAKTRVMNRCEITGRPHGEKDEAVPVSYSRKVLRLFPKAKKKLNIVKKGDHSLSNKKWLNIILKELKLLI